MSKMAKTYKSYDDEFKKILVKLIVNNQEIFEEVKLAIFHLNQQLIYLVLLIIVFVLQILLLNLHNYIIFIMIKKDLYFIKLYYIIKLIT